MSPFLWSPTKNSKLSPPPLWENTMQFTVCKTHKSLTNRWKCKFKKQNKQVCKASLLKSTWDQYDFKRRCQLRMKAKRQNETEKISFPHKILVFSPPLLVPPSDFSKNHPPPLSPPASFSPSERVGALCKQTSKRKRSTIFTKRYYLG